MPAATMVPSRADRVARGDGLQAARDVREGRRAQQHLADDQECPPFADNFQRLGDGAELAVAGQGVHSRGPPADGLVQFLN